MAVLGTGAAGDPERPELTHAEWDELQVEADAEAELQAEALARAEAAAAAAAAAPPAPKRTGGDQ